MNENRWGDMTQLRMAAESLADAINVRVRVHNRIRSGSGDLILPGHDQLTPRQIADHPLGGMTLFMEKSMRDNLRRLYEESVPLKVREWALSVPILKSGELFPRIVGLTGNPRWAVPLRMEGTGKDRKAVPDGVPYARFCTCGMRAVARDRCECPGGLRSFWQWCGRGDPDLVPEKGNQEVLLRMGKVTTVSPLLYTFSTGLIKATGRDGEARSHPLYQVYERETRKMRGHEGKCPAGTWPQPCAKSHRVHCKDCQNHKIPPMSPDGCGTVAHREWGEIGSPWRPGHVNMHGHRMVEKELLRQFWRAAEGTEW